MCEFLGYKNNKWAIHRARAGFPTCANQLGRSEDDRRTLGHWAHGSQMMERYYRDVCVAELRLGNSIFGKITNGRRAPTGSFEVPHPSAEPGINEKAGISQEIATIPSERDKSCLPQPEELLEQSGDDASTSSATWDNRSDVLSDVDISDLHSLGWLELTPPVHVLWMWHAPRQSSERHWALLKIAPWGFLRKTQIPLAGFRPES